jgi:predicted enzyme related to lactoylglutathione lyase
MSRIESYKPGSFVWAELATTDPEAAKKFYGDMFGWSYFDAPMPQGVYTLFQIGGDDVAAVYQAHAGMPPNWGVYFSTDDVDASAAKAKELGADFLMPPADIGDPGKMAILKDPRGVPFSLWQAKNKIGATYGGPLGQIMWPEISSNDPTATAAFYGALFGWTTRPESDLDKAQYAEWQHNGQSIGGLLPMIGEQWKGVPEYWGVYVTVADCDERAANAEKLGGKICVPPRDIPNTGRFSMISDPQGARINIIQMAGAHQPATA